jgi:NAD(P)-dependent dehydrogenase (short-subunit alcohol dehydrogenase family)
VLEAAVGVPVTSSAPSLWTRYDRHARLDGYLAIAMSQSGQTPEITRVMRMMHGAGAATLAITNDTGSRYAVSKWAVRGITKAASADLAPLGIRVNAVIPGLIESALSQSNPPGYNEGAIEQTPLRRIGQAADVAAGVVYLASAESSFVTGTDLVIDGGLVG